jgi:hypothetical protein
VIVNWMAWMAMLRRAKRGPRPGEIVYEPADWKTTSEWCRIMRRAERREQLLRTLVSPRFLAAVVAAVAAITTLALK